MRKLTWKALNHAVFYYEAEERRHFKLFHSTESLAARAMRDAAKRPSRSRQRGGWPKHSLQERVFCLLLN